MEGNYIMLGNVKAPITDPDLWRDAKSEAQYFQIKKIQQQKPQHQGFLSINPIKNNDNDQSKD